MFDGICNLCNGLVNILSKLDKKNKFVFLPLQSEKSREILATFSFSIENINTLIFIRDDAVLIKSTAILNIFKELDRPYRFLYYFIFLPKPLRDFAYYFISSIRYKLFGKRNECDYRQ